MTNTERDVKREDNNRKGEEKEKEKEKADDTEDQQDPAPSLDGYRSCTV